MYMWEKGAVELLLSPMNVIIVTVTSNIVIFTMTYFLLKNLLPSPTIQYPILTLE